MPLCLRNVDIIERLLMLRRCRDRTDIGVDWFGSPILADRRGSRSRRSDKKLLGPDLSATVGTQQRQALLE